MVRVDGGGPFHPAVSQYGGPEVRGRRAPRPSTRGFFGDVYLTFDAVGGTGAVDSGGQVIPNLPAGSIAVGVVVEPLIAWMWVGGLLIGVGGLLALCRADAAPADRPGVVASRRSSPRPRPRPTRRRTSRTVDSDGAAETPDEAAGRRSGSGGGS